ncbi:MAG: hypothetical protein ACTHLK_00005 [Brucella intermedia]
MGGMKRIRRGGEGKRPGRVGPVSPALGAGSVSGGMKRVAGFGGRVEGNDLPSLSCAGRREPIWCVRDAASAYLPARPSVSGSALNRTGSGKAGREVVPEAGADGKVQAARAVSCQVRLCILGAELHLLYEGNPGGPPHFSVFAPDDVPVTAINGEAGAGGDGRHDVGNGAAILTLSIGIDPRTRRYVLAEGNEGEDGAAGSVCAASETEIVDHAVAEVACGLARGIGGFKPASFDAAVEILLGFPLAMIKRRLILRTLSRFSGDRLRAAAALGISLTSLEDGQ